MSFHAGEQALQARTGARARLEELGPRVIRAFMPEQHRSFFAQLPFLVLGLVDAQGQPWASVLAAPPGFVQSPDDRHLSVAALPALQDPVQAALVPGAAIGLLGIEPHTRRRNRANGVIGRVDAHGFSVNVQQSFGNCPKYIQAREPRYVTGGTAGPAEVEQASALDEAARRLVAEADTFFIATAHPAARANDGARAHGVDVSHRGGKPGFVRVDGGRRLIAPDFVGNFFFNTLGNLLLNPRAGLLFIDYAQGDLLHVAVTAHIVQDGPDLAAFEGAQRLLQMEVTQVRRLRGALPLRWGPAQPSPYLAATGRWPAGVAWSGPAGQ